MPVEQLIRILTASIAPVVVISGVGLLLLSMTNRFGRVIDRSRALAREIEQAGGKGDVRTAMLKEQLEILYRRGKIMRGAILFSSACVLCVCIGILSLFASQVFGAEHDYVCTPFFALALFLMIPGILLFIRDITVSLEALDLEVRGSRQSPIA